MYILKDNHLKKVQLRTTQLQYAITVGIRHKELVVVMYAAAVAQQLVVANRLNVCANIGIYDSFNFIYS